MKNIYFFSISLAFLLSGCHSKTSDDKEVIKKYSDTDKFKSAFVKSQHYTINPSTSNVIESQSGKLILIPVDAFIDLDGNSVKDSVQIELAEASEIDEMISSNLVMSDPKAAMETLGSFFLNATQKGKQLHIDNENPLYVEIPMQKTFNLYKGTRNSNGDMHWDSIINPVKYLFPVLIDMLNFYPNGFEFAVEHRLPYKSHKNLSKALLDSLYFSFSYVEKAKIEKYDRTKEGKEFTKDTTIILRGINPASVKAITDKRFEKTFIATREFEARLQVIFKTCNNQILDLYVKNLSKNLWEIDQMAADLLGKSSEFYSDFIEYSSLKQTNVKISEKQANALTAFYRNKKEKIERETSKVKLEVEAKIKKREKNFQKQIERYESLLEARHEYRMNKFGFELTQFGWYNAARKVELKNLKTFELNVSIDNGKNYDRTYSYVVNPPIRSIFSLISIDKTHFNMAYSEDPDLLLWQNQSFTIVGVGYKSEKIGYKISECIQQPKTKANINLEDKTPADFKKDLTPFSKGYLKENKILTDLDYQEIFYREQQQRRMELDEAIFIDQLGRIVFPCNDQSRGSIPSYPTQKK